MTIPAIRETFYPPTPEQESLIGSACLALTPEEREEIAGINFLGYQYSPITGPSISDQVSSTILKAKVAGSVIGAVTGTGVFSND